MNGFESGWNSLGRLKAMVWSLYVEEGEEGEEEEGRFVRASQYDGVCVYVCIFHATGWIEIY